MTPGEQATAHDANFVEAIGLMARYSRRGSLTTFGPYKVAVTGVPGAFFNATWVLEAVDDVAALRSATDHLRATGLPFVVHHRSDLADGDTLASDLGLANEGKLPCFAMEPGPVPPAPAGVVFRRVGADDWQSFLQVTADGFGMPVQLVDELYSPAMLDHAGVRGYMGIADGHPVTCGVSIRTGAALGIYSIATIPEARGKGYGTAMTWELIRDADPGWDVAVLQASDMGRPIYERMGFKLVREFVELIGRPPA